MPFWQHWSCSIFDPMKKLFDKDEVLFAVLWIVVYVMAFSLADGVSEAIGIPKGITVVAGLALSLTLTGFLRRNQLLGYVGLQGKVKQNGMLGYVPLAVATTVPLWAGVQMPASLWQSVLGVISMCFVGFLEEVIFRGLLFKAMSKTNLKAAVIVSSLTFGMGHAVNLLLGAPVLDTLLQLVYASAAGFCFTAIFCAGGSILPCILSHALLNSLSVFGAEATAGGQIIISAVQTVIHLGYGFWLFYQNREGAKAE